MFKGISGLKGCWVFVSEKWDRMKAKQVLSPFRQKKRKRSRNKDVCCIYGNKRIFIFKQSISKMNQVVQEGKKSGTHNLTIFCC